MTTVRAGLPDLRLFQAVAIAGSERVRTAMEYILDIHPSASRGKLMHLFQSVTDPSTEAAGSDLLLAWLDRVLDARQLDDIFSE